MMSGVFRYFLPLKLSFLIFSMLLNCMGIIILKYASSDISYTGLGALEFFKDIPIALMSLVAVNFINRYGTKISLTFSLFFVFLCCAIIPFMNDFWFLRIWFAIIGVSFAIAKISIFAIIRNNSKDEKELSKVMTSVEASFMIGLFCVNIGFGLLLNSIYESYWKFGFWLIALISVLTLWLLRGKDYKEIPSDTTSLVSNYKEIFTFRNIIFFSILFLIVFIEQGFNSWLPLFHKENLGVNSFYALQSASFLALFSFVGRVLTSKLITKINWWIYISTAIIGGITLMVIIQLLIGNISKNLTILLFILPLLGLFLSPLYPLYNSKFLINLEREKINIFISLIVIFSSLGGSFGSLMMAYVFEYSLGDYFILFSLLPLLLIFIMSFFFIRKKAD